MSLFDFSKSTENSSNVSYTEKIEQLQIRGLKSKKISFNQPLPNLKILKISESNL